MPEDPRDQVIEALKMRIRQLEEMLSQALDLAHYACTGQRPESSTATALPPKETERQSQRM